MPQELVPGDDLGSIVQQRGCLGLKSAVAMLIRLLETIEYLLENGVIHHDLHPGNLVL